jgi:CBS domain containing-hemolysin-like protein
LGATHWKKLAPYVPMVLNIMIYSPFFPVIVLARTVTMALKKDKNQTVLSRSEFKAMAEIGIREGIFKEEESKILTNLMVFNNIQVESIMTPRTIVLTAPEDITIQNFFDRYDKIRYSRIPIYKGNVDNITGYILKDDLMQNLIENKNDSPLSSIIRNIMVVNEQMPIIRLFYRLIGQKEHIALVVGEYGEMVGIVTMEDIIETLLGTEIMDEFDNIEDMQVQAKKNWEKRAKRLGMID